MTMVEGTVQAGEFEGAEPASNGIECPESPAPQGFGERSEDFCAALRHKSNGIFDKSRPRGRDLLRFMKKRGMIQVRYQQYEGDFDA